MTLLKADFGFRTRNTSSISNRQNLVTNSPLSALRLFSVKHPWRETFPSSSLNRWIFWRAINCCSRFFFSPHPHMSSPEAKGNLWDKVILVWEKSTLSWQLLSAACDWWLNMLLVCQDQSNILYFDINMECRFWWRAAVNLFDLLSWAASKRHVAGSILSWACCVIGCGCGFGKLILRFHIQGVSSAF